nr:QueT transporter family protein [Maliibacterium massiliense]
MLRQKRISTRTIVFAALIAAVYTALSMALKPIAFGVFQLRVSECLTVLPALFPFAIPGLFVGCALTNLLGGYGLLDIVLGSLATLIAGCGTYKLRRYIYLAPLPPVLANALIVGLVLHIATGTPYLLCAGALLVEQGIICYGLGLPLLLLLRRRGLTPKL